MRVVSLAIMGRISLLAGVLLATVTQAMSEPYVLICKVQRLQNMPHWELIDRIFVDEPTQRIDFVASTTIGADKEAGSLEVGKWADIAVWDRNPYTVPTAALKDMVCEATWFRGRIVFRRNATAATNRAARVYRVNTR